MTRSKISFCEHDDKAAMIGLSLSYGTIDPTSEGGMDLLRKVAKRLAGKGGGEDKFLEAITIELDMTMPRYFWSEFDTYRVGMTKQSASTMHTLLRRGIEQSDFAYNIPEESLVTLNTLREHCAKTGRKDVWKLKALLPEGFLQRRIIVTNYKTLSNIYHQRKNHALPEWKSFCKIVGHLDYPWYITGVKDGQP